MEKRGCKWERPLKAAFVSHQTGATLKHPDLSSHPFYLPRSLSGQSKELPCFWGIFRYGLRGRRLTPCPPDVTGVRPSKPPGTPCPPGACRTARGVAGGTGLAAALQEARGSPQRCSMGLAAALLCGARRSVLRSAGRRLGVPAPMPVPCSHGGRLAASPCRDLARVPPLAF